MNTFIRNAVDAEASLLSQHASAVWSSFIVKNIPSRPDCVHPDAWAGWIIATPSSAPRCQTWLGWCNTLKIPFEALLLHIATYTTDPQTAADRYRESSWRSTTLRRFYGRIPPTYYPLLDRLLNRTVEVPRELPRNNLRERRGDLIELRRNKWAKLLATRELTLNPINMPDALISKIRPKAWRQIALARACPQIENAGHVAIALGIPYREMFEVYCYAELMGGEDSDRARRNRNNVRSCFNKSWPPETREILEDKRSIRERRMESRQAYVKKRNELLLEAFENAAARAISKTEAGDIEGAGIAKVEARSLSSRMMDLRIAHTPIDIPEKLPLPINVPRMEINNSTGVLEPVDDANRASLTPHPIVAQEALPPPPPPPPPVARPTEQPYYHYEGYKPPPPPLTKVEGKKGFSLADIQKAFPAATTEDDLPDFVQEQAPEPADPIMGL